MGISLDKSGTSVSKGGNISLVKAAEKAGVSADQLTVVKVGCGWDARSTTGTDFDLDVQAVVTDGSKVVSEKHFVYWDNMASPDGAVTLSGDNLTGAGDGDDETVTVDLTKLPAEALEVVVVVNIYDAEGRKQSFGQVRNAYVRVLAGAADTQLVFFDLDEDFSTETTVVVGKLYRVDSGSEWKFKGVGEGYATGLKGLATDYGLNVA